ncbi:MAG: peroxide stress protein YaaA [Alphaproteobacteria bacterium]|nr:peroxide stress protein YaaA [Alphaproteobacteria bacterium]
MLVVVSPAKKLNMDPTPALDPINAPTPALAPTVPDFADRAAELAAVARGLTADDLQKLMGISASLATLNADRFAAFGTQPSKPAALAFAGDTYQGLEASTLEPHDIAWAQDHLRILSGLYGVLRPMDAIEPYRLEMGSRLATARGKTLYDYWGADLAEALNRQAAATGATALVNCASQEYFGAVDREALALPVLTPVFKEMKNGTAKIISFHAKKARGAMARFMIQNTITDPAQLKEFSTGGYAYDPASSDDATLTFIRDTE